MPPKPRPEPSRREDPRKQQPASIESEKDPRDDERRRVGPEDEDRRLHEGEERPLGQMP